MINMTRGYFGWSHLVELACWVQRCYPRMPGRWRLTRFVQTREFVLRALPARRRSLAPGFELFVDPADYDGFNYLVHGINPAEPVTRMLMALLDPGHAIIDVGANVGYMSLVASWRVGSGGSVVAFEASPATFSRLAQLRTPYNNVTRHHLALADREGELEFSLGPADHSGMASLRPVAGSQGRIVVKAVTLDPLLKDLPRSRLVKIDVEGAELLALRGMTELIARDRPLMILELTPSFLASFGHGPQDILGLFAERGYVARNVRDGSEFEGMANGRFQCDLVFVPHESIADFDRRTTKLRFGDVPQDSFSAWTATSSMD